MIGALVLGFLLGAAWWWLVGICLDQALIRRRRREVSGR